jgi:phosphate transport system permease protein
MSGAPFISFSGPSGGPDAWGETVSSVISDHRAEGFSLERREPMRRPPSMKESPVWIDKVFSGLAHSAAILTLLLLFAIIGSLVIGAWPAISEYGISFLWHTEWDPVQNKFGGLVMIYGTVMTSIIALLIAVPVSFGIALFLTELAPGWLRRPLGIAVELLAAVPSIVYGMWGLLVFSPVLVKYVQLPLQGLLADVPYLRTLVSGSPVGIGILSAGIILAIMITPFHVEGVCIRIGIDHLGGGLQGCASVHQDWRRWRDHAGTGSGHRRDDGGHFRYWQLQSAQQPVLV